MRLRDEQPGLFGKLPLALASGKSASCNFSHRRVYFDRGIVVERSRLFRGHFLARFICF